MAVSKLAVQFNFGWKAKVYLKCLVAWCTITMREPDYDKVAERLVKLADTKVIPVNE